MTTRLRFDEAADRALAEAMADDDRVVVLGEDIHLIRGPLYARFGPDRVIQTPISEAGFVGAAVGAALGGLRPVAELIMVDFVAVALDAVLNHAAKVEAFTDGSWPCPLVLRAPCGGWYGDGGQHGQALWGMLGAFPGLSVVVPSTPADVAGALKSAIALDSPVVVMEPKLLSDNWRNSLGDGGRGLDLDVPADGAEGDVPDPIAALEVGRAAIRRAGGDVTIAGLGVAVHRALEAAEAVAATCDCEVIDLRWARPLDVGAVVESVRKTGALVVVDEDYRECGLSGELAAILLEVGLSPRYARVCLEDTLPFARDLERAALPNPDRIREAVLTVMSGSGPGA